jgi:heme/copper-type cytochrome/quinol oxidase subunit 1
MSIEKTGAVISRGIGVGLIVMAASSLLHLPIFQPSGMATSGWTSYSPNGTTTTTPDLTTQLHDTYFVISNMAAGYLPSAAQAAAGFVMILLSRPIGRRLAKGLREGDTHDAA